MRLLSLQLNNFLSHEDTKIEFSDSAKLLLDGVSGSGKSSIPEALIWALYGVGRVDSRGLISHGKKGAKVNLALQEGERVWRIVRGVNNKGAQTLEVSCDYKGEAVPLSLTSIKEKQAYIEREIIRSSYELFVNSVAYPQDKEGSFVTLSPAGRKDLLMEIIGAADLDEWADKAKAKYAETDRSLAVAAKETSMLEATIKAAEESLKALEEGTKGLAEASQEALEASEGAKAQEEAVKALEEGLAPLLEQAAEARALTRQIEFLRPKAMATIDTSDYAPAHSLVLKEEQINRDLIAAMSAPVDQKCLKCGEPWHLAVADKKRRIEELTGMLDNVLELKEGKRKEREENQKKALQQIAEAQIEITKAMDAYEKVKDAGDRAKVQEERIRMSRDTLILYQNAQREAEIRKTRIQMNLDLAEKARESLDTMESKLERSRYAEETLAGQLEDMALLKEAFGANGIKVMVIEHLLPSLELKINEVLSELSDFRVKLDTQRAGVKEGSLVDGLFITIVNGQGAELDFDGYSGGEKLKIIVAISEALATLQKAEFRIIDELFSGLDPESTEKFAEVLLKIQERFGQLLVISHLPEIKGMFENKITVAKKDGVSTVV